MSLKINKNHLKEKKNMKKLDRVAPLITDPPPISFTTLSENKKK